MSFFPCATTAAEVLTMLLMAFKEKKNLNSGGRGKWLRREMLRQKCFSIPLALFFEAVDDVAALFYTISCSFRSFGFFFFVCIYR